MTNTKWVARLADVAKQTDQSVLAQIATSDANPSVRLVAVRKLTDRDLLERIYKTDAHLGVREAAVHMITTNFSIRF